MRRSRVEIKIGQLLKIGQRWRRLDDRTVWTVAQVHRKDCVAEMRCGARRDFVSFERLRCEWVLIVPATHQQEAA